MTRAIEWEQVHERLRKSEAALTDTLSPNPARLEAVLRKRAEVLRTSNAKAKLAAPGVPSLVFQVGGERYAIELAKLAEVLPYNGCTRVPGAVPEFLGVVNLRGELRPVIDLGLLLTGVRGGDGGFVLMLGRKVGLKADSMKSLEEIRTGEIAPCEGRFLRGRLPSGVLLLDASAALSSLFPQEEYPS